MDEQTRYVTQYSVPESEALAWVRRQTNLRTNFAHMLSSPVQGALLTMLCRLIAAKKVLELGTFTGYSTICLAEGVGASGHVDTMERNDELLELVREGWSRAGVEDRITLWQGDCLHNIGLLPSDGVPYDLVYIDADKRSYCAYFNAVLPLVRRGGLILADNTLWGGKVLEKPMPVDSQTREIHRFNDLAASCEKVEAVMLPLRDGITLLRVK